MHDRFLAALQTTADVSLVAALRDPRLGFPDDKDLRVFIPDLHLISQARQQAGHFRFATNNESLLVRVLGALKDLKSGAVGDEQVNVIHLGDILDLWREVPFIQPSADIPARIGNDHSALMNALRDPDLDVMMFFGNHDFELYHWASYDRDVRHVYIPEDDPHVLVVHGDVFDWLERLPDFVQDIAVFLFAPNVAPTTYALGKMRQATERTTPNPNYVDYIKCSAPASLGQLGPTGDQPVPAQYNLQRAGAAGAQTALFETAVAAMKKIKTDYNLDICTTVIGHTHHARIVIREEGSKLFTLIDCGAWIENCVGADGIVQPNSQIAALCGNEARVYQLRPLH
jgi:UDP-2,3-diacylglucosamine pyrophosphatase LpxH